MGEGEGLKEGGGWQDLEVEGPGDFEETLKRSLTASEEAAWEDLEKSEGNVRNRSVRKLSNTITCGDVEPRRCLW